MSGRHVILVDGRPAGMIQSYETEVDLLIGEEELTGRGLGAQILSQFVEEEMSETSRSHSSRRETAAPGAHSRRPASGTSATWRRTGSPTG